MRDRDILHHEIEDAQADLEASLASLKDAVRYEVDPKRNAERALHFASTEVRGVLSHAWAELLALTRELRHIADHEGLWAMLVEIGHRLVAVTRGLVGAGAV
jgi:hypothetical protein